MQFHADRASFDEAIKWVHRTVGDRSNLPALAGIKLSLSGDVLIITSTNAFMSSEVTLQVQGSEDGSVLVQGKLLRDVIAGLSGQQVQLSLEKDQLVITSDRATFTLRVMQLEDFPTVPSPNEYAGQVVINAKTFSTMVGQVGKAVSTEDVRVALTGMRLELANGVLTCAATDSYRLSVRTNAVESNDEMAALITKKAMDQAKSAADALGGDMTMVFTPSYAVFQFIDRRLVTTLLDGKFPPYTKLIPEQSSSHLRINRKELAAVVKRVSVIGEIERTMTPVIMDIEPDAVTIRSDSNESGRASETLPGTYDAQSLQIAFNPRFLMDGLDVIESEVIDFAFNDHVKPAVIRPATLVDGEHEDTSVVESLYLLMPVRTTGSTGSSR